MDNMPDKNEMPELKFKAVDAEGRQIDCDTLFMFESPETGKNYIVYTDDTKDDNGLIKVYASCYNPNKKTSELMPIETDREWKVVEAILESIQEENKKGN